MDEILATLRVRVLVARRSVLDTGWRVDRRFDPFGSLIYVESGSGFWTHHGRTFHLRPGLLYLCPARSALAYRCPARVVLEWLHFTAAVLGGLDLFDWTPCRWEASARPPGRGKDLMRRLRLSFGRRAPGGRLEASGCLLELLSLFIDPQGSPSSRQRLALRFRPVLEHIETRLHEPVRIPDLARLVHLEPTHFSTVFARLFGMPPVRYLAQRRVEAAQRLLVETDRTLERIAGQTGFHDAFHLSRTFKRVAGVSPSLFRRQGAGDSV